MGILNVFKKHAVRPSGSDGVFVRNYINMDRFRGTRRLHVTVYGDAAATKNAARLLGDEHMCDCIGRQITLTGFEFDGGSGIRVAIDGQHIGVVWNHGDDDVYIPTWNGDIDGVFVRLESGLDDRPEAKLFVKLTE